MLGPTITPQAYPLWCATVVDHREAADDEPKLVVRVGRVIGWVGDGPAGEAVVVPVVAFDHADTMATEPGVVISGPDVVAVFVRDERREAQVDAEAFVKTGKGSARPRARKAVVMR